MKLSQLLEKIEHQLYGPADIMVSGITYDSRRTKQGDIFVALPGHHVDGKTFISQAVAGGAVVIIADTRQYAENVTSVVVSDPLAVLAEMSATLYGHPDKKLLLVGITGTNGKTTITYFLESIFKKAGRNPGVLGTVNYRHGATVVPAPNTTPQSADIYRIFGEMVEERCDSAIMEVSSHALALGRVKGIEFDIAVFTNLTQDHLDFHKTMDAYFDAKTKLFSSLGPGAKSFPKFAIINLDDPWGKKLTACAPGATVVTYGISEKANVSAQNIRISSKGAEFILVTPQGRKKITIPHLGLHNIYNALATAAAALSVGIPFDTVISGLQSAPAAPGRLEKVDDGQQFTVVVDYAHTDDALKNVISALKELKPQRLITVFGCGGDRDRAKRPLMGEIATALSDYVFVTSDNPRSEDPQRIALDIEVGIRRQHRNNYQVLLDREQAIATAISMAQKGDIILIAGKGHENYQIIGDTTIHFNDVEIAHKYLRKHHTAAL
jgi:UDP-N-acetylmuramoyl-L-alanyl-D-glutamate--2,6-diaminopimelate ligase